VETFARWSDHPFGRHGEIEVHKRRPSILRLNHKLFQRHGHVSAATSGSARTSTIFSRGGTDNRHPGIGQLARSDPSPSSRAHRHERHAPWHRPRRAQPTAMWLQFLEPRASGLGIEGRIYPRDGPRHALSDQLVQYAGRLAPERTAARLRSGDARLAEESFAAGRDQAQIIAIGVRDIVLPTMPTEAPSGTRPAASSSRPHSSHSRRLRSLSPARRQEFNHNEPYTNPSQAAAPV